MSKFVFNTKDHGSVNDRGNQPLPGGKNDFKISKVELIPVKADQTGARKQLAIQLTNRDGRNFTQFLEISPKKLPSNATKEQRDAEDMRARIASETFNAFLQAIGFEGAMTTAKFKLLVGKVVGIEVVVTKKGDNEYSNIRSVNPPYDSPTPKSKEQPSEEEESDQEEEQEEYTETVEEEQEEDSESTVDRPW